MIYKNQLSNKSMNRFKKSILIINAKICRKVSVGCHLIGLKPPIFCSAWDFPKKQI